MTDIAADLKQLRLYGMASSYAEVMENSTGAGMEQATWLLRHLIQAEQTDRDEYRDHPPGRAAGGCRGTALGKEKRRWVGGRDREQ